MTAATRHTCNTCRFWSEMCAQTTGLGPIEALCLSVTGPRARAWTKESETCPAWKSGHHGAVDAPPNYGEFIRTLYDAEDGAAA